MLRQHESEFFQCDHAMILVGMIEGPMISSNLPLLDGPLSAAGCPIVGEYLYMI